MKIKLQVKYLDGTSKDCDAVFADFIAFERVWNKSVMQLESDMRMTDMAWLAWHALLRQKLVAVPFEPDWIGLVEIVTSAEDEGENPLEKAQPTG